MLKEAILESSLPHKEKLASLVRQSYYLMRYPSDASSQDPGVSRFGGLPDLPASISWPAWKGKSLSFVAQINLGELPPIPERFLLPESGLLFFFYDAAREAIGDTLQARGCFAVYHVDSNALQTKQKSAPADLNGDEIIQPARIAFKVVESEPGFTHPILEQIGLSSDETLAYFDVLYAVDDMSEGHRILGYPTSIQNPAAEDCEWAQTGYWEASPEARPFILETARKRLLDWELLLQVASDERIGMYWPPDCGILYYMIRRSDLLARRFDQSWMVKQFS